MDNDNEVYYRLYRDDQDKVVVVCMQWFDELDYVQDRFITDKEFSSEKEALDWYKLNTNAQELRTIENILNSQKEYLVQNIRLAMRAESPISDEVDNWIKNVILILKGF